MDPNVRHSLLTVFFLRKYEGMINKHQSDDGGWESEAIGYDGAWHFEVYEENMLTVIKMTGSKSKFVP